MILGISRVQWALYETGRRDIPLAAKQQLAVLLLFVQQLDKKSEDFLHIKIQEVKRKKVFEQQRLINKHKQMIVEKKLKSIEKKYEAAMTALSLVRFLETKAKESSKEKDMVLYMIKRKAEMAIEKNGLHLQAKHQLKLQALQQEEMLIKKIEQTIITY
ncbi:MAG: hypothetical protein ABI549_11585 [Flavobacterium sp.]|uniref:hypothetical protein n=1 Tax=Flavobacterium sp. TaxID=239 RepID=UPI00326414F5